MSDFSALGLPPMISRSLDKLGYHRPTPIQAQSIPHLLKGKDLLGIAQTGTGKTAAFSLPLVSRLVENPKKMKRNQVRSLILTPTRELATQINDSIKSYSKNFKLNLQVIFGGVGHRAQISGLNRGIDILVATPGRLLDLMNSGHVNFQELEVFILDEADRMLDMGFIRDIKKIVPKLPKVKQTLLFSATMPADIKNLAESLLRNPVRVEVTPKVVTVEKIDQQVRMISKGDKNQMLKDILQNKDSKKVLVFTRTKHGANRVVKVLDQASIASAAIHGNKSQSARERALGRFKNGNLKVLVATDIAARGIDVPDISHVINFNLPEDPECYVHRIGRTARAGKKGVAISFCDPEERKLLKSIEKFIKKSVPVNEEFSHQEEPKREQKVAPRKKIHKKSKKFYRKRRAR